MNTRPKVCEVAGCRKHVKHMMAVKMLFAHQVDMRAGMVPIYKERHLFRCDMHVEPAKPGECIVLTIADYDARVAQATNAIPR